VIGGQSPGRDGSAVERSRPPTRWCSGASNLLDLAIEAVFAASPPTSRSCHTLFYVHSAGNERTPERSERLINTGGGAQDSRFVGGSQLISIAPPASIGGGS